MGRIWMNLEDIMLNETSQSQIMHDSSYMRNLKQSHS